LASCISQQIKKKKLNSAGGLYFSINIQTFFYIGGYRWRKKNNKVARDGLIHTSSGLVLSISYTFFLQLGNTTVEGPLHYTISDIFLILKKTNKDGRQVVHSTHQRRCKNRAVIQEKKSVKISDDVSPRVCTLQHNKLKVDVWKKIKNKKSWASRCRTSVQRSSSQATRRWVRPCGTVRPLCMCCAYVTPAAATYIYVPLL